MKADIPDSIIISRDDDGVLHHSYWTTDQQPVPFEATKFIRKDALLEWAKETQRQMRIEAGGCYNTLAAGKFMAYKEIFDKIESL